MRLYRLNDEGAPEEATDLVAWLEFVRDHDPVIAHERIGDADVCTVFLGVLSDNGPPGLYVSSVQGGFYDTYEAFAMSPQAARETHFRLVMKLRQAAA